MKKNQSKKLVLNKVKIVELREENMGSVRAGAGATVGCETADCVGTLAFTIENCGKPILW